LSVVAASESAATGDRLRPPLGAGSPLRDFIWGFARYRTWLLLGWRDIHIRYRRSLLGPFWISISMAVMILSLAYLYGQVFNEPFRPYLTYLACGFLAWNLLSGLINDACNSVVESEAYLRNVPMPLTLMASRTVFRQLVYFLHNAIVVVPVVLVMGTPLTPVALEALGGVGVFVVFGLGACLALAPICTRFRDLSQLVANLVQMLFFLTPIFWNADNLPQRAIFVDLNPCYRLIELIRGPLLGRSITAEDMIFVGGTLAAIWVVGLAVFIWSRRRLYFWL
jgi:ABC-type polysaccharide/polyol phosphate export permease